MLACDFTLPAIASQEELENETGIIYGILDKLTGRWYIGQTINEFTYRYAAKNWWQSDKCNLHLKRTVEKYGIENFEVFIFERGKESYAELNKLETEYIIRFNALHPNGFNFNLGGTNRAQCEEAIRKKSKHYTIKDMDGKIYHIFNGAKFCRENGVNTGDFWRMLKGDQRFAGKFCLPETDIGSKYMDLDQEPVVLCHRDGREETVFTLAVFARKHGLNYSSLNSVVRGLYKTSGGWFLKGTLDPFKLPLVNKAYEYLIASKDGVDFRVENATKFEKEHGLSQSTFSRLIKKFGTLTKRGLPFQANGFVIKEIFY